MAAGQQVAYADQGSILVLEEVGTGRELRIEGGCILGRSGDVEPDIFNECVSYQHAKVVCDEAGWAVYHLSLTNPTKVSDKGSTTTLTHETPYPLRGGELIQLANMKFRVKIDWKPNEGAAAPIADPAGTPAEPDPDLVEGWFVKCPACKTSYMVEDENARLDECRNPNCYTGDRKRVAKVAPKRDSMRKGLFEHVR